MRFEKSQISHLKICAHQIQAHLTTLQLLIVRNDQTICVEVTRCVQKVADVARYYPMKSREGL